MIQELIIIIVQGKNRRDMTTPSGKVVQIHGKRYCKQCKEITDQTCFWMKYRQHTRNDDACEKEEKWFCERCETNTVVTKEIPIPMEKAMLVKLLMLLSERYELEGTTISVESREVRAVFRFSDHDLRKLRAIAENWADRGYITARDLLKLEKAAMRNVAKMPRHWAPSKRELIAGLLSLSGQYLPQDWSTNHVPIDVGACVAELPQFTTETLAANLRIR